MTLLALKLSAVVIAAVLVADLLSALVIAAISVWQERRALRNAGALHCRESYFAAPGAPMARRMTRREIRRRISQQQQSKKDVDAGATSIVY